MPMIPHDHINCRQSSELCLPTRGEAAAWALRMCLLPFVFLSFFFFFFFFLFFFLFSSPSEHFLHSHAWKLQPLLPHLFLLSRRPLFSAVLLGIKKAPRRIIINVMFYSVDYSFKVK